MADSDASAARLKPLVVLLQSLSNAFLDAYALVDASGRVVAYNRQFFDLFPKHLARRLKRTDFDDLVRLELAEEPLDVVGEARRRDAPVRYDQITGYFTDGPNLSLIVTAAPVRPPTPTDGEAVQASSGQDAVLVFLRDMTDLAEIQTKYQRMLGAEAQDRARLERTIEEQGRELLERGDTVNALRKKLAEYRRGLLD